MVKGHASRARETNVDLSLLSDSRFESLSDAAKHIRIARVATLLLFHKEDVELNCVKEEELARARRSAVRPTRERTRRGERNVDRQDAPFPPFRWSRPNSLSETRCCNVRVLIS